MRSHGMVGKWTGGLTGGWESGRAVWWEDGKVDGRSGDRVGDTAGVSTFMPSSGRACGRTCRLASELVGRQTNERWASGRVRVSKLSGVGQAGGERRTAGLRAYGEPRAKGGGPRMSGGCVGGLSDGLEW